MEEVKGRVPWSPGESLLVLLALLAAGFACSLLIRFLGLQISLAAIYLLVGLAQAIVGLGGLYYYVYKKYSLNLQALGITAVNWERALTTGVSGGVALFIMVIIVGSILQKFIPEPDPQPFAELIINAQQPRDLLIPLFMGIILAPVTEELYFRGFLFPALKERYGVVAGFAGSSMLFGMVHLDLVRFFPLTVGGLGLAYLYHRSGNLLVPITAHATWNGIMLYLLYISLQWV